MFVASGRATLAATLGGCVLFLSLGLSLIFFLAILGVSADVESGQLMALQISAASIGAALECRIDESVGVLRALALLNYSSNPQFLNAIIDYSPLQIAASALCFPNGSFIYQSNSGYSFVGRPLSPSLRNITTGLCSAYVSGGAAVTSIAAADTTAVHVGVATAPPPASAARALVAVVVVPLAKLTRPLATLPPAAAGGDDVVVWVAPSPTPGGPRPNPTGPVGQVWPSASVLATAAAASEAAAAAGTLAGRVGPVVRGVADPPRVLVAAALRGSAGPGVTVFALAPSILAAVAEVDAAALEAWRRAAIAAAARGLTAVCVVAAVLAAVAVAAVYRRAWRPGGALEALIAARAEGVAAAAVAATAAVRDGAARWWWRRVAFADTCTPSQVAAALNVVAEALAFAPACAVVPLPPPDSREPEWVCPAHAASPALAPCAECASARDAALGRRLLPWAGVSDLPVPAGLGAGDEAWTLPSSRSVAGGGDAGERRVVVEPAVVAVIRLAPAGPAASGELWLPQFGSLCSLAAAVARVAGAAAFAVHADRVVAVFFRAPFAPPPRHDAATAAAAAADAASPRTVGAASGDTWPVSVATTTTTMLASPVGHRFTSAADSDLEVVGVEATPPSSPHEPRPAAARGGGDGLDGARWGAVTFVAQMLAQWEEAASPFALRCALACGPSAVALVGGSTPGSMGVVPGLRVLVAGTAVTLAETLAAHAAAALGLPCVADAHAMPLVPHSAVRTPLPAFSFRSRLVDVVELPPAAFSPAPAPKSPQAAGPRGSVAEGVCGAVHELLFALAPPGAAATPTHAAAKPRISRRGLAGYSAAVELLAQGEVAAGVTALQQFARSYPDDLPAARILRAVTAADPSSPAPARRAGSRGGGGWVWVTRLGTVADLRAATPGGDAGGSFLAASPTVGYTAGSAMSSTFFTAAPYSGASSTNVAATSAMLGGGYSRSATTVLVTAREPPASASGADLPAPHPLDPPRGPRGAPTLGGGGGEAQRRVGGSLSSGALVPPTSTVAGASAAALPEVAESRRGSSDSRAAASPSSSAAALMVPRLDFHRLPLPDAAPGRVIA